MIAAPRAIVLPILAATIMAMIACGRAPAEPPPTPVVSATPAPPLTVEQWRAKHETDYRRDWVSIAGLFTLKPGANTAGSAKTNAIVLPASTPAVIGRFVLTGTRVRFEPVAGAPVRLKD